MPTATTSEADSSHFEFNFLADARNFAQRLIQELTAAGFKGSELHIDHICYRTSTVEKYEALKTQVDTFAVLLSEAYINGRPIASYQLNTPLEMGPSQFIPVLEIPAPKNGQVCADEFEHIEVVVKGSLEEFMATHAHHAFRTSNFKAAINRDISLVFGTHVVKFHEATLKDVIALEQAAIAADPKRHLAIFDLDDTLFESGNLFLEAMHASLQAFVKEPLSFQDVCAKARSSFPEFLANFEITEPQRIQEFLAHFQLQWFAMKKSCAPFAGIKSLLSCLFFEGFEIEVWTARDLATTRALLGKSLLDQYVMQIYAYDGVLAGKPVPHSNLVKSVQSAHSACLVGDSSTDCAGAANLEIPFLQAAWIHNRSLISAHPHSKVCKTPFEALIAIMECKKQSILK